MIRFALICLALAGCTQITTAQNQAVTFTQGDIANALAVAQAAGPAGAEIVPCLTFIQAQLPAIQATASTSTPAPTVGVATAFVKADLAFAQVGNAISPTAQSAFETACGPVIIHIMNQGLTLSAQMAALAALMVK